METDIINFVSVGIVISIVFFVIIAVLIKKCADVLQYKIDRNQKLLEDIRKDVDELKFKSNFK
jgi:phage gp36-like protein